MENILLQTNGAEIQQIFFFFENWRNNQLSHVGNMK